MAQLATYVLRIMATDDSIHRDNENQEVVDALGDVLSDVEGQISNQLPEGYYAKIDDQ